jgi:hypothetical protein
MISEPLAASQDDPREEAETKHGRTAVLLEKGKLSDSPYLNFLRTDLILAAASLRSSLVLPGYHVQPLSNFIFSLSDQVYTFLSDTSLKVDHDMPPPAEIGLVYEKCLSLYASAAESLKGSDDRPAHILFAQ